MNFIIKKRQYEFSTIKHFCMMCTGRFSESVGDFGLFGAFIPPPAYRTLPTCVDSHTFANIHSALLTDEKLTLVNKRNGLH